MNGCCAAFLRRHLNPFLWGLIGAVLLLQSPAYAGTVIQIDADRQYEFADDYFAKGEYLRAVDEYKRFVYFFPDDARVERAMFQCGMAFYLDRRYADAVDAFYTVMDKFSGSQWAVKSYFMLAESHIRLNQISLAVIDLQNLITLSDDRDTKDEAYYRLGWIYVETASWDNARVYFNKISAYNHEKYKRERLAAELDQIDGIDRKSPALAGALAIVPGAGQLYCERYQDALISFLLNGLLIWAAYEAFDNDNPALGALLTFFEVGFYAGNIYGAVGSAHKYNHSQNRQFIENLKKKSKISFSGDLESKSLRISVRFAF